MILKLDIERVRTIDEVRDFMAGSEPVDFHLTDRRGAYDFVTRTLRRLNYAGLSKADKALSANMTETPASFGITVGRWR